MNKTKNTKNTGGATSTKAEGEKAEKAVVNNAEIPKTPTKEKEKSLNVVSIADAKEKVNDIEVFGNVDLFQLISKESSESQGWMKSTKAIEVEGIGCIVQVTTQHNEQVAEALTFVPNVKIVGDSENKKFVAF